jgi:type I restriction enzyme M protein
VRARHQQEQARCLKDKVLFINADREYAEGKNQNKLRPEDIEKIDHVFTHKLRAAQVQRLVDKTEIVETSTTTTSTSAATWTTRPDPEPEDVQAPPARRNSRSARARALDGAFAKFGLITATLFRSRTHRLSGALPPEHRPPKPPSRRAVEAEPALQAHCTRHSDALAAWWQVARKTTSPSCAKRQENARGPPGTAQHPERQASCRWPCSTSSRARACS